MSYILDALRRADSERERERGAVPGLHAKPVAASGAEADDGARGLNPLVWVVVGLALLLVGVLAWLPFGRDAPAAAALDVPEPAARVAVASSLPAPVTASVPAPMGSPASAAPSAPPAAPTAGAPARAAAVAAAANPAVPPVALPAIPAPPPQAAPIVRKAEAPVAAAGPRTASPGLPASAPAAPASAALGSAASVPEARIAAVSELPQDIQRQLPQLVIGGSVYSPLPASRFLIVNGQVFHEGDKPATDLLLEQIRLKSAVLRFKGHRYEVFY